jgi:hypothetical protein
MRPLNLDTLDRLLGNIPGLLLATAVLLLSRKP